jgi:hypothetical protein
MEKKSICKSCVSNGEPYKGQYGTKWSWSVEFENGDKGLIRTNSDKAPFEVSKEEEYIIEEKTSEKSGNKYFAISKVNKNVQGGFKKKDPTIALKSYACSYSTRLALAGIIKKPEGNDGFEKFKTAIANSTKSFYKEMTAECANYGMDNADIVGTCMSKAIDVCVEGIIPKEEIYSYYRNLLSAVLVKQQPAQQTNQQ